MTSAQTDERRLAGDLFFYWNLHLTNIDLEEIIRVVAAVESEIKTVSETA